MDLVDILMGGFNAFQDYVAYHVLTCLIPAFLLTGAISAFLSKELIVRYMGSETRKIISFPLAALCGMFLAVCSCTVIPLAAGLHRKGSSVGPAFILLWTAPATNLLAIVYTGAILGYDLALWRALAAISTSFIIGLVMMIIFGKEEHARTASSSAGGVDSSSASVISDKRASVLMVLLAVSLLAPNYVMVGKPYWMKVALFTPLILSALLYAFVSLGREQTVIWVREAGWYARMIFPLLLIGSFIAGIVGRLLPQEWVHAWLGGAGLQPTFLATLIGAVSYFATLTEAPFVHTLMQLGMGKGPALALLLAGPGLSLPNMIAVARVFGARRTIVYVGCVIMLTGLIAFALGNTILQ